MSKQKRVIEKWMELDKSIINRLSDNDWLSYVGGRCLCAAHSSDECICGVWARYEEIKKEELLDSLEDMARQHCFTDKTERIYNEVKEVNTTDSSALSANAEALRTLSENGRFRIIREVGRMVIGYWPEHDPEVKKKKDE